MEVLLNAKTTRSKSSSQLAISTTKKAECGSVKKPQAHQSATSNEQKIYVRQRRMQILRNPFGKAILRSPEEATTQEIDLTCQHMTAALTFYSEPNHCLQALRLYFLHNDLF
uniref:Uncharacterized protein n=1 Tax=Ascaris lumbricoides TaxID=6252 RepID=A0A9J2PK60_ASCLU